jgi:hypothetical protein
VIKWTDFALLEDFGAILDFSDVVTETDINHDRRWKVAQGCGEIGSIRSDAEDGMRIQETESVITPARMVGTSGSDDLKLFPTGRMLGFDHTRSDCNLQAEGGA